MVGMWSAKREKFNLVKSIGSHSFSYKHGELLNGTISFSSDSSVLLKVIKKKSKLKHNNSSKYPGFLKFYF